MTGVSSKVPLGELAQFRNGGTPSRQIPAFFEGDIPWITGADIQENQVAVRAARSHITPEAVRRSATNLVPEGTILLVTRTGVGKAAVAGVDLAFSQDITAVIHDRSRVDGDYLVRYLLSQARQLAARAQGATIRGVTRVVVEEMLVPLPSIGEQRRIAGVLDAADALRTKRRQTLAKLDTLTQAIFIDMVGESGAGRFSWPLVELGKLVRAPITRGIDQPGPDLVGGVPYLKTTDFRKEGLRRSDLMRSSPEIAGRFPRSIVEVGDIVICIRATVGPTLRIDDELAGVNLSRGTARVSPSAEILSGYLHAYMSSGHFIHQIARRLRGATFLQIPLAELRTVLVPLAPLDVQRRVVDAIHDVDALRERAAKQSAGFDTLFASLQQRAFRGEL